LIELGRFWLANTSCPCSKTASVIKAVGGAGGQGSETIG
jgi:hypothetical protein